MVRVHVRPPEKLNKEVKIRVLMTGSDLPAVHQIISSEGLLDIFIGISLTLVLAAIVAGILQRLRQPIIIGYILTGLIVGPVLFNNLAFKEVVDSLSQIGIALLLFIIGLSLSPRVIREVGRVSFFAGLGQVLVLSFLGTILAKLIGFDLISSLYLGLGFSLSSTIVIMKLLSDKKDLAKLYSKITIGILLIQDLIVSVALIGISAFRGGEISWVSFSNVFGKGIIVFDLVILFALLVLPRLSNYFAKSQEFLFLFSVGWGLGVATLFRLFGFSMEIGALVAGIALSTSPFHFEISSRLRPLRDFFIVLFFILLGSRINLADFSLIIYPVAIFSIFVLFARPIIISFLAGITGYRKKVSFMASINFTQISEFSLILVISGQSLGQLSEKTVSIVVLVSLLTMFISSYLVLFSEKLFPFVSSLVFERKRLNKAYATNDNFEVVLFGCHRIGFDFIDGFRGLGKKFLVVDFNPEVIKSLEKAGVNCRYGDVEDNEFLEELNLGRAKMVISTIPDFEVNEFLIGKVRELNREAILMVVSHEVDEAIDLYDSGASYVVTPHFLGEKYASMLISKFGFDMSKFVSEKEKHLKDLNKRQSLKFEV